MHLCSLCLKNSYSDLKAQFQRHLPFKVPLPLAKAAALPVTQTHVTGSWCNWPLCLQLFSPLAQAHLISYFLLSTPPWLTSAFSSGSCSQITPLETSLAPYWQEVLPVKFFPSPACFLQALITADHTACFLFPTSKQPSCSLLPLPVPSSTNTSMSHTHTQNPEIDTHLEVKRVVANLSSTTQTAPFYLKLF